MIDSFRGKYAFLSTFYPSVIVLQGITYTTAEHAYQACKTTTEEDKFAIALLQTPGQAKRFGRKIKIRDDWRDIRIQCMIAVLERKFSIPSLAAMLVATGEKTLREGNTWGDTYWGVCDGKGKNNLGICLMNIRHALTRIEKI